MSSPLPRLLHAFRGLAVHAPEYGGGLVFLRDHLLAVAADSGRIVACEPYSDEAVQRLKEKYQMPEKGVQVLGETQFLIPGFIDTHCHAPQFQFAGTGTDRDLMVWLQHYTFPAEMRMADTAYAKEVYSKLVRAALKAGTTSAFYYATIHLDACKALADECARQGQRAFVGKVNMDQHAPEGYTEDTQQSLRDTETFIEYVRGLKSDIVQPVITPRFIPTCSLPLLEGLGKLAAKHQCWIQSHASESSDQVAFVQSLHPNLGADASAPKGLRNGRCTGIFNQVGLLTDRCMMAHGTFLDKDEWDVFRDRGVSLAHCPLSNSFCSDRYLRLKPLMVNGNKVGLGSDVAGGYQLSILANIRAAVVTSKFHTFDIDAHPDEEIKVAEAERRAMSPAAQAAQDAARLAKDNTVNGSTLSYKDAFRLATAGGAEAINMSHELGQFGVGYLFDAQLIDVSRGGSIHLFPCDSMEDMFQKFINLGDDRQVAAVYVQGRQVVGDEVELKADALLSPNSAGAAQILPGAEVAASAAN